MIRLARERRRTTVAKLGLLKSQPRSLGPNVRASAGPTTAAGSVGGGVPLDVAAVGAQDEGELAGSAEGAFAGHEKRSYVGGDQADLDEVGLLTCVQSTEQRGVQRPRPSSFPQTR
jgi:hypothetical protein